MNTSRYDQEVANWAPHPTKGWVRAVHRNPTRWVNQPYEQILSTESEDMLLIANRKLGDARRYWAVADMNPSIECPDDLMWGTSVKVPLRAR